MTVKSITSFDTYDPSSSVTRPANTTAYAAGDVVSNAAGDRLNFDIKVDDNGLGGSIDAVIAVDAANQSTLPDLELWLFDTDVAAVADNAAFAPTDAEMLTLVGVIDLPLADWKVGLSGAGASGNAANVVAPANLPFRVKRQTAGTHYLYGVLVARNAYTPISAEVFTIKLVVSRD